MYAGAVQRTRIAPGAPTASLVAGLFVDERQRDVRAVVIPRVEIHIVARFGLPARGGLDVHAMGGRRTAHRKVLGRGQRAVTARLALGAPEAVLGISAAAVAGRIVALQELWGDSATGRLLEGLAGARDMIDAAHVLEAAIAERAATAGGRRAPPQLALEAADRLTGATVNAVASDLGVSERHLRRVFREAVGVGPKTYAKLARFHRALRAAARNGHPGWAGVAAEAGYYDQAHLIAEFRAIAGVTPQALLAELRAAPSVG